MTNLYMHLGDGSVPKDHVPLDTLVRMDAKTYADTLVGVIATGEGETVETQSTSLEVSSL